MNTSTIAACSTGAMPCAIAAVRLSGPLAKEIADQIFQVKGDLPFSARKARTMHYGKFFAKDGALLDFGLAVLFPAPGSYTGEDLVEFYPHGSQAVVSALLDHCFARGAIPAPPGEYTKRAFLNNRLDLTEAEAVADIIHSTSELAAKTAAAQLDGAVGGEIRALREQLTALIAHFYAVCDYPDEDLDEFLQDNAIRTLDALCARLDRLYRGFERGRLVREGVPVAIIGKPNAGKSTLFNALAGSERAIVTDEAGTTRDVIEEVISVSGAPIRVLDTAGLREAAGLAEAMGIERARAAAKKAQAILCVLDVSRPLSPEDEEALALAQECPQRALVLNKIDLLPEGAEPPAISGFDAMFPLSAKNGSVETLANWLAALAPEPQEVLITSARQAALLQEACTALQTAADCARMGLTADAFLSDAERGLNLLGQITGETASADIAQAIFGRFCVGK